MSYFSGAAPYSLGSVGTLTTSAGSSTVTVTCNSSIAHGDLLVLTVYAEGDITRAVDAGEGWVCLDCGYNSTDNFGLGLFGCVMSRSTTSPAGLTLPASMPWTAHNYFYRPLGGLRWDLSGVVGSKNWFNDATSATAGTRPRFAGAGLATFNAQGLQVSAFGYDNGGTTTNAGTPTNWSERFDTGQVAPPHGIILNDKLGMTTVDHNGTFAANLGVAKTKRAGVRAFIPLIGAAARDRRTMDWRRTGS